MAISIGDYQLEEHDDEKFWTAIELETGFANYQTYLDEYCDREPFLTSYIDDSDKIPGGFKCDCVLLDVSETGSLSKTLTMKMGESQESPIEILRAIRNPPLTALFRILIIEPKDVKQNLPWSLINVLGLGLRITPDFFKAYLARNNDPMQFFHEIPLRASHEAMGRSVFMLARKYLPASPTCPPVLLIMGHPAPPYNHKALPRSRQTESLAFAQPAHVRPQGLATHPWPSIYERFFRANIDEYLKGTLTTDAALVYAILPLLETHLERLKRAFDEASHRRNLRFGMASQDNHSSDIWKKAQEDREHEMEEVRFRLKRWIRTYDHDANNITRYLRTQGMRDIRSFEAYTVICEEAKECLEDAHGLEVELRDWLQLRVGSLALQESKKSIQISNLQIEESQRVKIVTVLAFVYVPLNLATSIFGMNIQQLNYTGQPVWVFIITTILAVFLTFFVWFLVEQRVGYVRWRRQMITYAKCNDSRSERTIDYNLMTRVAILFLLLRKGYHRWAGHSRNMAADIEK